jgi:hypothetical protein
MEEEIINQVESLRLSPPSDDQYLKNEKWKCSKSPTGSHFWKVISDIKKGMLVSDQVCRYCETHKKVLKKLY